MHEGQSAILSSEYRYARCSCKIGSKYESLFCLSLPLSPRLRLSSSTSSHRFNKTEASGSSQAIPACAPGIILLIPFLYSMCIILAPNSPRSLKAQKSPKSFFGQIDLQNQGNCGTRMPRSLRSAENVSAPRSGGFSSAWGWASI